MSLFNNPDVVLQSWYAALPAGALRRGAARTVEMLGRRITLFRDIDGVPHALDARCPHLGADLGLGCVEGRTLRCAFHGWTFEGVYPVEERYGLLWLFNGPAALFPLPSFEGTVLALKPQTIRCHPHVIAANGLDLGHFEPVHRMSILDTPRLEQPDLFRTSMSMRVRFAGRGAVDRILRALGGNDVPVIFTTIGGNMATVDAMLGRIPVRILFTHRPDGAWSHSRTFVFAPNRMLLPAVLLVLARIVRGDREILDRIDFRPNLTDADWPLAAFIRQVEAMSPGHPERERGTWAGGGALDVPTRPGPSLPLG